LHSSVIVRLERCRSSCAIPRIFLRLGRRLAGHCRFGRARCCNNPVVEHRCHNTTQNRPNDIDGPVIERTGNDIGPIARAGFPAPPLIGPPRSTPAASAKPMASGCTPSGTRGSVATATTVKTSKNAIRASTRKPCMIVAYGVGEGTPRCAMSRARLPYTPHTARAASEPPKN